MIERPKTKRGTHIERKKGEERKRERAKIHHGYKGEREMVYTVPETFKQFNRPKS